MITETKICKLCQIEKSADAFSRQTVKHIYGTYIYLSPYCKPCAVVKNRDYQARKPKKGKKLSPRITATTKICNECQIEKPHDAFSKRSGTKGDRFGLASRCKECERPRKRQWHKDNPVQSKANKRRWDSENVDYTREYNRQIREANPELHAYRFKRWQDNNRAHLTAKENRKRAKKILATPKWLSLIQHCMIEEFYELAAAKSRQTGKKYHVDHIVPLNGKSFNGLHVPWNLQIVSAFDNLSKKNRRPKELSHMFWEHL